MAFWRGAEGSKDGWARKTTTTTDRTQ
jgi:hypothetical protein